MPDVKPEYVMVEYCKRLDGRLNCPTYDQCHHRGVCLATPTDKIPEWAKAKTPDVKPLSAEDLDRIHLLAFTGSVDGRAYPGGSLRALQQMLAHANDLTARLAEAERKAEAFDWLDANQSCCLEGPAGTLLATVEKEMRRDTVEAAGRKE